MKTPTQLKIITPKNESQYFFRINKKAACSLISGFSSIFKRIKKNLLKLLGDDNRFAVLVGNH